jgi:hypothetical protein
LGQGYAVESTDRNEAANATTAANAELAAWREDIRRHALAQLARKPEPPPRSWRIGALAFLFLLHAVMLVGLREAMRLRMVPDETPIHVSWIDLPQPEPSLPQPSAVPAHHSAPSRRFINVPQTITPPTESPVVGEPEFRAYNPDGSVNIPSDLAQQTDRARPEPSFTSDLTDSSTIMRHQRPLKVRPNHFAQTWYTPSDSPLADFVERNLTARKEFRTPWGSKIVCVANPILFAVLGGCAWGFPPPHWEPTVTWKPAGMLDEQ